MSSVLRRLVTVLGFRINKTGIGDYEKSINSVRKNVNQLNLSFNNLKFAIRGAFFGNVVLSGVALSVAKTINSFDELSQKTGISIQNLQALETMSNRLGNGYGELTKTMSSFADQVSSIKNPILRLNTLQSLMIDKNKKLSNVFNLSSQSFKELRNESNLLVNAFSQKDVQNSKEYIKSWAEFRTILDNIRTDIGLAYMPLFNDLSLSFKNWYLENKKYIRVFADTFATILANTAQYVGSIFSSIIKPIGQAVSFISDLNSETKFLSNSMSGLGIVLSYVYPLFLPIGRIAKIVSVSIIGLSSAINDFIGWMNDADSVFGSIFGKWEDNLKSFANTIKGFNKIFTINPVNLIQNSKELGVNSKESFFKKENFSNLNNFYEDSIKSWFLNQNQSEQQPKINNKNLNLNPSYSIRIDNITVGNNISIDQAKSFGEELGNIVKSKIEFTFLDMINNLKS